MRFGRSFKSAMLIFLWLSMTPLAFAISPYIRGDKVQGGGLAASMSEVEKKLQSGGFSIVGKYKPKGIPDYGVIVFTDKGILDAIHRIGGDTIVGAGLRVGVKSDGSVSYINPDYWYRAYFRKKYDSVEPAVKAVENKLKEALGAGEPFGGDVAAGGLAKYHYMFGMEYFDDNRDLASFPSFEKAVETIRSNLGQGVAGASKIYEVVMPDKKIAVFGVGLGDPQTGDGHWVGKIEGAANIAALPYEIFVVGDEAQALYARYRIALSYPALKMTSFGRIMSTPSQIQATLKKVAGASDDD